MIHYKPKCKWIIETEYSSNTVLERKIDGIFYRYHDALRRFNSLKNIHNSNWVINMYLLPSSALPVISSRAGDFHII